MAHIDTSEVIRASIWIRPAGGALERIQKVLRLAHQETGRAQVPSHVTLLTGAEMTRVSAELKLKHLATRLKPFTIRLGNIEWRDEYFRCLYAAVELNDELAAAQRDAYDAFDMNPAPPFEPHLSLLYGKVDESMKKQIAAEAGGRLDVQFDVRALHLVNSTSGVPVAQWHTLVEQPLLAA
ncbi:MAG: 2 3 cyclic phosphodiesterase [Betaproteobacteria bacterium]|nr:2 3 cyclic phosphodiesterase [Betaproteobacteria bacterium]